MPLAAQWQRLTQTVPAGALPALSERHFRVWGEAYPDKDDDAAWLFAARRSAAAVRDIKIGRATHLMHLEENRHALYREAEPVLPEA